MTVSNKPGHRGEREVSRKTIARGMPGRSGVTVVTMLVCFVLFRTRGCGRIKRPAFPAPSDFLGGWLLQKLGRLAPRDRGVAFGIDVIARRSMQLSSMHNLLRDHAMDALGA